MTLIDTHGRSVDPFAPLGTCAICGADAWTTTAAGRRKERDDENA